MQQLSSFLDAFVGFTATGVVPPAPRRDVSNQYLFPKAKRVIAIGDLHGDVNAAQNAFRLAGLINEEGRWIGGSTVCVQLLYWMERISQDAEKNGGKVILINGNHEYMNIQGRFRYAPENCAPQFDEYMKWFAFGERLKRRCGQEAKDIPEVSDKIPEQFRSRFSACRPGGPLCARFFADKNTVVQVGTTIFVHAGLLPHHVNYGIERINSETKAWMEQQPGKHHPPFLNTRDSMVWTRVFSSLDPTKIDCEPLWETLKLTGAKRMVMGHTVQPQVTARCKGDPQVLEILDDTKVRVLASPGPDGRAREVTELKADN